MLERETGIEPATSGLGSRRSTAELLPLAHRSVASLTPPKTRSQSTARSDPVRPFR